MNVSDQRIELVIGSDRVSLLTFASLRVLVNVRFYRSLPVVDSLRFSVCSLSELISANNLLFSTDAHLLLESSKATDYDVEGWFANHGLPWTTPLSDAMEKWGVECVEHIKLLPRDEFLQIFEEEKFVVKETAKHGTCFFHVEAILILTPCAY